ncbi:MAG: class II fructose-bisphosphate aldolase [Alphaproteobacteria bacterium]|nr:class II fructose-bisphosphate aldolase [Alphaproteobacteria bacterium]
MGLELTPGVVYGDAYKALVGHCKENGYALPAVNVVGTNSINAVMEAAAQNRSDVIIQLSNGGAAYFAGQGLANQQDAMVLGAVSAARHVALLAEHYGICVVLHTDHANRKLLGWVDGMIERSAEERRQGRPPLFSSHMLDLSEDDLDDNLNDCERVLEKLVPLEMSLEIELGITGGEEDGVGSEFDAADNAKLYTQPEDVLAAYDRLSPIGHFSLAASFGNVHGVYKPGNVQLRPEILKNSQDLVRSTHGLASETPLDLVFHGGSGSETAAISEAIRYGVFKMNIDTDTQFAFAEAVGAYVTENGAAFQHQIHPETGEPLKKLYDPRKWLRQGEKGIVDRLRQAFDDLGSKERSIAAG